MKNYIYVFAILTFGFYSLSAQAQKADLSDDTRVNLLFGLNQPLLGGFNVEGNLFLNRLVFDYSHGVSLNMNNEILDEENREQGLDVHIPWTTGFGVGYRFNEWLNVRAEPKWHRFELFQMGEEQISDNLLGEYTTFSLGLGAYANLRPFKNSDSFLKGIMIAPSIRWWPRLSSSLEGDQLEYFNEIPEQTVTHKAMEVGLNNTPLIVNISVGYSLDLNK
jgi:hypothetical protein